MSASSAPGPPPPGTERRVLVVAGSGRSGTSLFTGLTGRLGWHIPKPEVKPNRSNPRGFGEPRWAVDFHNDLLSRLDVMVDDGRPEAWELTDATAEDAALRASLSSWLAEQLRQADRIVVKDPRLGWFLALHQRVANDMGAQVHVATLLRHPAEVLRSRELAYGTKTTNTTRVVGWANMMLGTELRTRGLPRAVVRYDDLLADWRAALGRADEGLGLGLMGDPELWEAADALVDPSLHRSLADWAELGLPRQALDFASRVYDAFGVLVDGGPDGQKAQREALDELRAEFVEWYDECFDIARSRTGARVRRERRQAERRARKEPAEIDGAPRPPGLLSRARTHLRRGVAGR